MRVQQHTEPEVATLNPHRYSVEVFYIYKAMPSGHGLLYAETSLTILDTIRLCNVL